MRTAVRLTDGWGAEQVRAAERPLLDAGVPLMARASAGLAAEALRLLPAGGRVLVLAGSGSNGGDALLAGALLARRGHRIVVARLGRRVHAEGLRAAGRAGAVVLPPDASAGLVAAAAAAADLVLDGVLGTGSRGGLRPPSRQMLAVLAQAVAAAPPVIAVDLPSGLDPDTGVVHGPVLRAAVTVTFGAVKAGLLQADGPAVAGRVRLVDIGLGPALAGVDPLVRLAR